MRLAAIDPYGKTREGLAIQRVSWISNRDCTRYLFKEWGISLCLIYNACLPTHSAAKPLP